MASNDNLLEARRLGRLHPNGESWLLDDCSLTIRSGDRVVLTGPSGSGKTLFLRALAALDPIDRGEIHWQGQPLTQLYIPRFRRQAIYLHQRSALFEQTVAAALQQPFTLTANRDQRYDRDRIVNWLQALDRPPAFLDNRVRELSGGEMQIVALLRALQLDPQVLLLDEPTSAMDAATATAVESLIAHWTNQSPPDKATVWVTHDAAQAVRVGQRKVEIEGGRMKKDA